MSSSENTEELLSLIARVENLNQEIKNLQFDRREVFSEAKARGYHLPALKRLIQIRAMDKSKYQEDEAILALYQDAVEQALGNVHGELEWG